MATVGGGGGDIGRSGKGQGAGEWRWGQGGAQRGREHLTQSWGGQSCRVWCRRISSSVSGFLMEDLRSCRLIDKTSQRAGHQECDRLSARRVERGIWKQRVTALRRVPFRPEAGCWQRGVCLSAHRGGGCSGPGLTAECLPEEVTRAYCAGSCGRQVVSAVPVWDPCDRKPSAGREGPWDLGTERGRAGAGGRPWRDSWPRGTHCSLPSRTPLEP